MWYELTPPRLVINVKFVGYILLNVGKTAEYQGSRSQRGPRYRCQTVGWQPSCRCNADVVPCTVLDMFGGVGTTAQAALKHGRDAILIELNADYIRLAAQRLDGVTGRRQPSWECGRPLHGDMNVKNFYLMELSSYCERNRRSEGSSP